MKFKIITLIILLATVCHAASLRSDQTGNFFLPDQTIRFEFDLGDSSKPHGNVITFNLLDYSNRIVASQSIKLTDETKFSVSFPSMQREGFFYLEAKAQLKQFAKCTLGVLEQASKGKADPTSRFGTVAHLKHMSNDERDIMLNLINRANIGWIREGFLWHEMEISEDNWTTERYDDLVNRALDNGIHVLPVLCFGTEWAAISTDGIATSKRHLAQPRTEPWQKYITKMVKHYGDRLNAWEIWNEPNLYSFWQPSPNAEDYANLAVEAANTIRDIAPNDTIITAGFSPCQSYLPDTPDQDEQNFVHALAHKSPLPFDAIGGHPYTIFHHGVSNAETEQLFKANRDALLNGLSCHVETPREFPLWMTEMGVSTIPRITTEREAAGYIGLVMTLACSYSNVERMILYNFRDVGTDPSEKEDMFGLVHKDYTPKPGYYAVHTIINSIGNATFLNRTESDNIVTHSFEKPDGSQVDIIWAAKGEHTYIIPETIESAVDITGNPIQLVLSGHVHSIQVGASPILLNY